MRVLIPAVVALCLLASPATAECAFKFCQPNAFKTQQRTYAITNESGQRLGDVYDPGHNRRLQLRDNHRRILGYIERSGRITNTSRQEVGTIEEWSE